MALGGQECQDETSCIVVCYIIVLCSWKNWMHHSCQSMRVPFPRITREVGGIPVSHDILWYHPSEGKGVQSSKDSPPLRSPKTYNVSSSPWIIILLISSEQFIFLSSENLRLPHFLWDVLSVQSHPRLKPLLLVKKVRCWRELILTQAPYVPPSHCSLRESDNPITRVVWRELSEEIQWES